MSERQRRRPYAGMGATVTVEKPSRESFRYLWKRRLQELRVGGSRKSLSPSKVEEISGPVEPGSVNLPHESGKILPICQVSGSYPSTG